MNLTATRGLSGQELRTGDVHSPKEIIEDDFWDDNL